MAARATKTNMKESLSWTKPGAMVKTRVPGVNLAQKGNLRPKIKGGKVKEVKASVPLVQPQIDEGCAQEERESLVNPMTALSIAASDVTKSILETDASTMTTAAIDRRQVGLRDLCQEDKKRVANLIKELAKIGEEKESAERNLEEERKRYEWQILKLVDQQEEILREREEVQRRMMEYHQLVLQIKTQQSDAGDGFQTGLLGKDKPRNSRHTEHVDPALLVDEPSRHLYLNDFSDNEGNDEVYPQQSDEGESMLAAGLANFSTQVQPSHSPHASIMRRKPGADGRTVNSSQIPAQAGKGGGQNGQRPFTALINQELERQQQALALAQRGSEAATHPQRPLTPPERGSKSAQLSPTNSATHGQHSPHANRIKSPGLNTSFYTPATPSPPAGEYEANQYMEDLPEGNLALLTPEKNELLSRYMQSRELPSGGVDGVESEMNPLKEDPHYVQESALTEVTRKSKHMQHLREGDNFKENFEGDQHRGHSRRNKPQTGAFHRRDLNGDHGNQQQHDKRHSHHHRHHHKRPPPSWGPLHPPVMSSTQKSSDFVDVVSLASTTTDGRAQASERAHKKKVPSREHNDVESGQSAERGQKGLKDSSSGQSGRVAGKIVDFSERHDTGPREPRVVEENFLERYRKMSPADRKHELLKQKSILVEEQARLRTVLAQKHIQMMEQEDRAKNYKKIQKDVDDEESIQHLQAELARREKELEEGKALLRQKLKTQDSRSSGEQKTSEDDAHKGIDKSLVMSSTPIRQSPAAASAQAKISSEKKTGGAVDEEEGKSGKKLTGKDGESCVLYSTATVDGHVKDETAIKRRLVYNDNEENRQHKLDSPKAEDDESNGKDLERVDAATSISYAHLPSENAAAFDTGLSRSSKSKGSKSRSKKSRKHPESPGEKTLSVLEIINSLHEPGLIDPPNQRHSSTLRPAPLSSTFPSQIRANHPGDGLISHDNPANFQSHMISKHSGLNPNSWAHHRESASLERQGATHPLSLTAPSVMARTLGSSKAVSADRDENLSLFQLKRTALSSHPDTFTSAADSDVIDLILASGSDLRANVDQDEDADVNLDEMYDNDDDDADSNLDEIVRALEERNGDWDEERIEDDNDDQIYSTGDRKIKGRASRRTVKSEGDSDSAENDVEERKTQDLLRLVLQNMDDAGELDEEDDDEADEEEGEDDGNDFQRKIQRHTSDSDVADIDGGEEDEWEDLEESQILEEVFFVQ